jgi:hypothetical protein
MGKPPFYTGMVELISEDDDHDHDHVVEAVYANSICH